MTMRTGTDMSGETRPQDGQQLHRAQAALAGGGGPLHELDYDDLALSAQGMRMVRRAAMDVLRRFSAVDENEVTLARALALFLDHVFWEEKSGGLLLCADFPDQSFCLPIPRDCWSMKPRIGRAQ
ncbi:MAG TPA: hypothetical protein VN419_01035 [Humidesulfovibrio sp.]|uniref:hypothetical protein n=1 Tax=Humidesulfovibrio sp. TaxID=2910988 RepID=UPI002C71D36A|nr:hypothetical protein [Humidesulfovibrio sp.]HWR02573.1 hypothetical protein [Humidesulfovibrio sp.]